MEKQTYLLRWGYRPILNGGIIAGELDIEAVDDRTARSEANKAIRKMREQSMLSRDLQKCFKALAPRWQKWEFGLCKRRCDIRWQNREFTCVLIAPNNMKQIHYPNGRAGALTVDEADAIGFSF